MTELTYPKEKLEVIVIDDASTDQTSEIAEEFAKEHEYIKVVHRSPEDGGKGKPAALNHGLKYVKREIVCCFDADYYPQRERLNAVCFCVTNDVEAVYRLLPYPGEKEMLTNLA
jgi:cellulose synthase/poly-beta-1,6-N-acetylglucosamine synthase-like glycosyltransferase